MWVEYGGMPRSIGWTSARECLTISSHATCRVVIEWSGLIGRGGYDGNEFVRSRVVDAPRRSRATLGRSRVSNEDKCIPSSQGLDGADLVSHGLWRETLVHKDAALPK